MDSSPFIHSHLVPKLYDFLSSVEYKRKCFETFEKTRSFFLSIKWTSEQFGYQHSSLYYHLCSAEEMV